jgi:hypothetical protein
MIPQDHLSNLSLKRDFHKKLIKDAEACLLSVNKLQNDIYQLKERNALLIFQARSAQQPSQVLKRIITLREMKNLRDNVDKQDKDFAYLKKPSQVPQAYETALQEMVRRKRFRRVLDADFAKIRDFVDIERKKRSEFSKHVHTYLPSQFCPQLRDQVPEVVLEGPSNEYDFADVADAIKDPSADIDVKSPFQFEKGSASAKDEVLSSID